MQILIMQLTVIKTLTTGLIISCHHVSSICFILHGTDYQRPVIMTPQVKTIAFLITRKAFYSGIKWVMSECVVMIAAVRER